MCIGICTFPFLMISHILCLWMWLAFTSACIFVCVIKWKMETFYYTPACNAQTNRKMLANAPNLVSISSEIKLTTPLGGIKVPLETICSHTWQVFPIRFFCVVNMSKQNIEPQTVPHSCGQHDQCQYQRSASASTSIFSPSPMLTSSGIHTYRCTVISIIWPIRCGTSFVPHWPHAATKYVLI